MTEGTLCKPTDRKGELRAKIASMLLDEVCAAALTAPIARDA